MVVAEKLYEVVLPYRVSVVVTDITNRVIKGMLVFKVKAKNASLAIEQVIANIGIQSIDDHLLLPYRFINTGKKAGENYWWILTNDSYCVVRALSRNDAREKIARQGLISIQVKRIKKPKLLSTPQQHADNPSSSSFWACEVCGETNPELMKDCCECGASRSKPFADTPKPKDLVTSSN